MSRAKRAAPIVKANGNGHTHVTAPGVNKEFVTPCPYCGAQVLGAITTSANGSATFGLSHGPGNGCTMVNAIQAEVQKDGPFDPTALLRASGLG